MFEARCGMPLGLSDVPLWHLCHLGRQWEISGWSRSVGLIERHGIDIRCIKIFFFKKKTWTNALTWRGCWGWKLRDEKSHLSGSPSHERSWQASSCRCRTQRSSTCHCWHVMCTASFFPGRPGAGGAIWPWRFLVCSRGPPTRQWNMRNGWEMDDVLLDTGPLPAFAGGIMPCHPLTSELPGWASKLVDCSL